MSHFVFDVRTRHGLTCHTHPCIVPGLCRVDHRPSSTEPTNCCALASVNPRSRKMERLFSCCLLAWCSAASAAASSVSSALTSAAHNCCSQQTCAVWATLHSSSCRQSLEHSSALRSASACSSLSHKWISLVRQAAITAIALLALLSPICAEFAIDTGSACAVDCSSTLGRPPRCTAMLLMLRKIRVLACAARQPWKTRRISASARCR
mmetsp:Transcript_59717/g.99071  ORF Transcript_59717/g.99071 Transcript_59717/m.99071 type:complete len:208 (+) Transcript_59717:318-941(+)